MAHAIGCLGSAVQTYRAEKAAARKRTSARRAIRNGPTRNQDRKRIIVSVIHEDGFEKLVLARRGHFTHVNNAFWHANCKVIAAE